MECGVMTPLLKCAALPQEEPHHPFIFIDLQNGLTSLKQPNYCLQLRHAIYMEVNQTGCSFCCTSPGQLFRFNSWCHKNCVLLTISVELHLWFSEVIFKSESPTNNIAALHFLHLNLHKKITETFVNSLSWATWAKFSDDLAPKLTFILHYFRVSESKNHT